MKKTRHPLSERKLILLIASVQFVNVLDFMMVMPMGPDFAAALGIPLSQLGFVGGSYTAAGSVAGLMGMMMLDRFDRKQALVTVMFGLGIATVLGGFAWDLPSLITARVLAGLFGGPATSLALSIIADTVATSRRGRAMSVVMGAFSVASIFGVPAGLEMARLGGWRLPFFAVGAMAWLIALLALRILPPVRAHLDSAESIRRLNFKVFFTRHEYQLAFLSVALAMFGAFMMIPNLSAYFQYNLGYPRAQLGLLYFVGGLVSLVAMIVAGRLVDRIGASRVTAVSTVLFVSVSVFGFAYYLIWIPAVVIFTGFMLAMSIRGVAVGALASRVPLHTERARYMSVQSAVQHIASACGAVVSTRFLTELPDKSLAGMGGLALVAAALSLAIPFILGRVESQVSARERASAAGN